MINEPWKSTIFHLTGTISSNTSLMQKRVGQFSSKTECAISYIRGKPRNQQRVTGRQWKRQGDRANTQPDIYNCFQLLTLFSIIELLSARRLHQAGQTSRAASLHLNKTTIQLHSRVPSLLFIVKNSPLTVASLSCTICI